MLLNIPRASGRIHGADRNSIVKWGEKKSKTVIIVSMQ